MYIETERLVIRDLEHKDAKQLFKIVWQEDVVRFMKDWSENSPSEESFTGYIDWHQTQKESIDVYECKRYAITLKGEDTLIGAVGMGLEETINEVEMAYFLDEGYQGNGYATEALIALTDWCMKVSDVPYFVLTIGCANEASCRVADVLVLNCLKSVHRLDINSRIWKVTVIFIIGSTDKAIWKYAGCCFLGY